MNVKIPLYYLLYLEWFWCIYVYVCRSVQILKVLILIPLYAYFTFSVPLVHLFFVFLSSVVFWGSNILVVYTDQYCRREDAISVWWGWQALPRCFCWNRDCFLRTLSSGCFKGYNGAESASSACYNHILAPRNRRFRRGVGFKNAWKSQGLLSSIGISRWVVDIVYDSCS